MDVFAASSLKDHITCSLENNVERAPAGYSPQEYPDNGVPSFPTLGAMTPDKTRKARRAGIDATAERVSADLRPIVILALRGPQSVKEQRAAACTARSSPQLLGFSTCRASGGDRGLPDAGPQGPWLNRS